MKKLCVASVILMAVALTSDAVAKKELKTSPCIQVKAPAEAVWALLIDVENWAKWNPAVESAELKSGDGEAVGTRVRFLPVINDKKATPITLTLAKSEKLKTIEYTAKMAGMDIVFGFSIEDQDGVSQVTSYETITGPGVALFESLYGQEGLDQEHQTWLEAIKTKLESANE